MGSPGGLYYGFLARQPGPPRRRAAGAVADRAAQTGIAAEKLAVARVELQRGGATERVAVVGVGRHRRDEGRRLAELVVAHQADLARAGGERGHPVVGT